VGIAYYLCDGVGSRAAKSALVVAGESPMTSLRCLFMVLGVLINPYLHAINLVQLSGDNDSNSPRTLRLPVFNLLLVLKVRFVRQSARNDHSRTLFLTKKIKIFVHEISGEMKRTSALI
jgi:hypothetical protein